MNRLISLGSSNDLMVSISGVRGRIPAGFSLETIMLFSQAFGTSVKEKNIVVARDSRPSGLFIEQLLTGVLLSMGKNIIQVGIVPTPTIKSVVNLTKANAGVMISASHNPLEWNAFKFIGKKGRFIDQNQINEILEHINNHLFNQPKFLPDSTITNKPDAYQMHIDDVLKRVNINKIIKKKFTVFIDAVNGAGSEVVPALLEKLGCRVIRYNCTPDGIFPRPPEPTPKALSKTAKILKTSGADIGFALDPDADRLVVLSPRRGAISEELTLPLSILSVLENAPKRGKVVVNLSSSFVTKEIISNYGFQFLRSKVGEANVVSLMEQEKAFFGGEGNGGVIDPAVSSYGRDALAGIAHILNVLAEKNCGIDDLLEMIPPVYMSKMTLPVGDKPLSSIYANFKEFFNPVSIDERDGLWMDLGESWLHIRPSNTEPIIRMIGEAKSKGDLVKLMEKAVMIAGK